MAVIEDVHWADEATIDLLSFLGRRLGRVPALLLATYRDDELAADHPLRMVLGDLATQRATRRMRLPPLSVEAVRALVGERDVDAAELHRITGGNPFYVSEMLEAGWPSVPPTVRDAVGARLARASPGTRQTVETAAVIGAGWTGRCWPWILDGLSGPADECLATGILVADGTGLRFRHELVRMAVEAGIAAAPQDRAARPPAGRAGGRGGADPALLAHHAEGAGDAQAVLRHAPEAARRSAALGAHREAAAQYRAGAAVRATVSTSRRWRPCTRALAGEYSLLDRWEEAEQALPHRAGAAARLGDGQNVGKDLRLLSTTLWRLCRGEESDRGRRRGRDRAGGTAAGTELAWAYGDLAVGDMSPGRTDEGTGLMSARRGTSASSSAAPRWSATR